MAELDTQSPPGKKSFYLAIVINILSFIGARACNTFFTIGAMTTGGPALKYLKHEKAVSNFLWGNLIYYF